MTSPTDTALLNDPLAAREPFPASIVFLLFLMTLGASGSATIVSDSRYPVTIENTQAPTYFSIQDRKNQVIHQGVPPQQVTLSAKAFPFWPAKYSVTFVGQDSSSEQHPVKAGFDPWIAGNLLLGGGAGAIIDGATGAMFKLPKTVTGHAPPQYAVTNLTRGAAIAATAAGSVGQNPGSDTSQITTAANPPSQPEVRTASASLGEALPVITR